MKTRLRRARGRFVILCLAASVFAASLVLDAFRPAYGRATASMAAGVVEAYESVTLNGYASLIYSISLNGVSRVGTYVFLRDQNERLYAPIEALQALHIRVPVDAVISYSNARYVRLGGISGLNWEINEAAASIALMAPASAFERGQLDWFQRKNSVPSRTDFGSFINYDLHVAHYSGNTRFNGLLDLRVFGDWGAGTSRFVYRNTPFEAGFIRLATAWRYDNPERAATLIVGDTITRPGFLGGAVRLGGIQYGTNFATQPYFITFPLPSFRGRTALPSTVDVYVNNVLKGSAKVPAGPFTVPRVPVVTGQGQVRLVVRDILGRERVIIRPFFASSRLLRPGLNDYSFSVGWTRENFGVASNDYNCFLATGLWRRGITPVFTAMGRATAGLGWGNLGVGGIWPVDGAGVLQAGFVTSHHDTRGNGTRGKIALHQQFGRFSYGASLALASPDYWQIGYSRGQSAPRRQATANASIAMGASGSLSLSYAHQARLRLGRVELFSATYSRHLGPGFFALTASKAFGDSSGYGIQLSFSFPFGTHSSASIGLIQDSRGTHAYANLQRSLQVGNSFGYRMHAETGPNAYNSAELSVRRSAGTYRIGASHSAGATRYFADASGGAVFLGGDLFATRRVDSSFALVEVPGFANVRVYRANQLVGRTNAAGQLLIPNLLPYQHNQISISPLDLPIDTILPTSERDAVPYYQSGVVVHFPIEKTRAATFTVVLDNGQPLPTGATINIAGREERFPTGLNGFAYVRGLAVGANRLVAHWNDQQCPLILTLPVDAGPQPNLGTLYCHGVTL